MGEAKRRRAVGAKARPKPEGQETVEIVQRIIRMPRPMIDESLELLRHANGERKKRGEQMVARGEEQKDHEPLDWNTWIVNALIGYALRCCRASLEAMQKEGNLVHLADQVPPPPAGKPLPRRLIVMNG